MEVDEEMKLTLEFQSKRVFGQNVLWNVKQGEICQGILVSMM